MEWGEWGLDVWGGEVGGWGVGEVEWDVSGVGGRGWTVEDHLSNIKGFLMRKCQLSIRSNKVHVKGS